MNTSQDVTIRFMGHASIYIKVGEITVITDPWFSQTGAFLASWFQFPRNDHLDLTEARNVDYVVLSHEHQDHFDLAFLKTLNKTTKIVIPQYAETGWYELLTRALPNEVIVVPSREKMTLGPDFVFCPVVQSVPIWDDCALFFETPEGVIADINDMKVGSEDLAWIKETYPDITYLFVQFSGANWHPYVYGYERDHYREITRRKVMTKFRKVVSLFAEVSADVLIPCAGPPCFLDSKYFQINMDRDSIFPNQADFYEYLTNMGIHEKTAILLPGDVLYRHGVRALTRRNLAHSCFTDTFVYLTGYQRQRRDIVAEYLATLPEPTESLLGVAQQYFQPLISGATFFRHKIDGVVLLRVTGRMEEEIVVDFTRRYDSVRYYNGEDCCYTLTLDGRYLQQILRGTLAWEDFLLSMRFSASRNPDEFNEYLIVFLRFHDLKRLKRYEQYEYDKDFEETFILEHEGGRYEVQRLCPHARGDLSQGEVHDGCIVCPLHGWEFSLEDGSCRHSCRHTITVKKL